MIDSNVWVNLHYTTLQLTKYYDDKLKCFNLTANQYILLKLLEDNSGPISDLATILGVDRTTMSRNILKLFDRGYVRNAKSCDKRKIIYILTQNGQLLLNEASIVWNGCQDDLVNYLTKDNVDTVKTLLDFICQHLQQSHQLHY